MTVIRDNGFVKLRRGIWEHVADGSMSFAECSLYLVILCNADPASGVWRGSAEALGNWLGLSPRTCRDQLANLERKGYLKRFQTPGKPGAYPIFVDKYECSTGAAAGCRLNASESTSSSRPVYDGCRESAAGSAAGSAAVLIENKRIREKNTRVRAGSQKPERPTDAWMSQTTEPAQINAVMVSFSKGLAEGKTYAPDIVRNVRAWEREQAAKKKGPAAVTLPLANVPEVAHR